MATIQEINEEITRIDRAKASIIAAIEAKGVEIPEGVMIEDLPNYIAQIVMIDPNDYYTKQDLNAMSENWDFTLENNTVVRKKVVILPEDD